MLTFRKHGARAGVEKLFRSARKKLFVAIVLGLVPIVVLMILASFGLKLGVGFGP